MTPASPCLPERLSARGETIQIVYPASPAKLEDHPRFPEVQLVAILQPDADRTVDDIVRNSAAHDGRSALAAIVEQRERQRVAASRADDARVHPRDGGAGG